MEYLRSNRSYRDGAFIFVGSFVQTAIDFSLACVATRCCF